MVSVEKLRMYVSIYAQIERLKATILMADNYYALENHNGVEAFILPFININVRSFRGLSLYRENLYPRKFISLLNSRRVQYY